VLLKDLDLLIWVKDSRTKGGINLLKGFGFVVVTNFCIQMRITLVDVGSRSGGAESKQILTIFLNYTIEFEI
jgi:hypothetical protein